MFYSPPSISHTSPSVLPLPSIRGPGRKVLDVSTSPSNARKMNFLSDTSPSVSRQTSNHALEPVAPRHGAQNGLGLAFPRFGVLS